MRMDAQLAEHFEHGRIAETVALEFNDDEWSHLEVLSADQVEELKPCVDGQTLGLCTIDKRDTVEVVSYSGLQRFDIITQMVGQELTLHGISKVHVTHLDSFFLRSAMVVLRLYLHELQVAAHIGTEAHLLATAMASLMDTVHGEVVCVEVGSVIA